MRLRTMLTTAALIAICCAAGAQQVGRTLDEFGPVETVEEAEATLEQALGQLMDEGGGVLIIPPNVTQELEIRNTEQGERRTRDEGPAVTIIDYRGGFTEYHVAPIGKHQTGNWAGFRVERTLNLSPESLPHWGTQTAQSIDNYIVSGSSSYMHTLMEPVEAGEDVRCYVSTIRGLWIGALMDITSSVMGYGEPIELVPVKDIGWDPERKRNYFTCDLEHDHPAGALVYNKHNVNGLVAEAYSNSDNQTAGEIMAVRHNYAVGDSFCVTGHFRYMGDVFSGFGDEGGIVFNAETIGDLNFFHSTVEAVDTEDDAVVYNDGKCNAHTLSTSRPLINMNRDKWITEGTVKIVSPSGTYEGETYPGEIGGFGNAFNYQGGAIIGSADCPWDESVIGRFFCVTDESEVILPGDSSTVGGYGKPPERPVYRWYRIMELEPRSDGTKRIKILRVRWSAVAAGAPNLFDDRNYTEDGREVSLSYAIAPGSWVYDVSEGWAQTHQTGGILHWEHPRTVRVVPGPDTGTEFDFAPGDEIEQPVGPDPWQPRPLRIRTFDQIPSTMPSATIEVQQKGRVQVPYAVNIDGIIRSADQLERRKDHKPAYGTIINMNALADYAIEFDSEVMTAAMMFRQPNDRTQPIMWRTNMPGSASILEVEPDNGEFAFRGGDIDTRNSGLQGVRGISRTQTPSRNLRGIDVGVETGATEAQVTFGTPEEDASYAVSVTPSWLTTVAVSQKTAEGFSAQFGTEAPEAATMDWVIVR
ncbi:MAG: hypothetical protein GF393_07230 [Armatimonadia bacterium]|nr:hypothetical protein [Armatimonadia bacterium]